MRASRQDLYAAVVSDDFDFLHSVIEKLIADGGVAEVSDYFCNALAKLADTSDEKQAYTLTRTLIDVGQARIKAVALKQLKSAEFFITQAS